MHIPFFRIFLLILFASAVYGIYWTLSHPKFTIDDISISGISSLSEAELRGAIDEYLSEKIFLRISRTHYFFVSSRAIEQNLKNHFPKIKEITAIKQMPDKLAIWIEERVIWGIACNYEIPGKTASTTPILFEPRDCVYIDGDGFAFAPSPILGGFLTKKIYTNETTISIGHIAVPEGVVPFYENMIRAFVVANLSVTSIEYAKDLPRDVKVYGGAWYALVARDAEPEKLAGVLKPLIATELKRKLNELQYIDLRFGNKVFYKLRSK